MVLSCAAFNCTQRWKKDSPVSFHSFPKHAIILKKWLSALRRANFTPTRHSKICSKHFNQDCFEVDGLRSRKCLKLDAVPSVFDFPKRPPKVRRSARPAKRIRKVNSDIIRNEGETFINESDIKFEVVEEKAVAVMVPQCKKRKFEDSYEVSERSLNLDSVPPVLDSPKHPFPKVCHSTPPAEPMNDVNCEKIKIECETSTDEANINVEVADELTDAVVIPLSNKRNSHVDVDTNGTYVKIKVVGEERDAVIAPQITKRNSNTGDKDTTGFLIEVEKVKEVVDIFKVTLAQKNRNIRNLRKQNNHLMKRVTELNKLMAKLMKE